MGERVRNGLATGFIGFITKTAKMVDHMDIDPRLGGGGEMILDPRLEAAGEAYNDQYNPVMQTGPEEFPGIPDDEPMEDEVSDADTDDLELQADIERFDRVQANFAAEHHAEAMGVPYEKPKGKGASKGSKQAKAIKKKRGPRKPAKPEPDIMFRLSHAQKAYERKDYDAAIEILRETIRINSETYQAWTLLSTIHEELDDHEKATICLISAAHLMPKNAPNWVNCALYALRGVEDMDTDTPERKIALERVHACYTYALQADKTNIEARVGKADSLMMLGQAAQALHQYQRALELKPFNIRTVRNMADVAFDVKDTRKSCNAAKAAYKKVIDHLQETGTFEAEEGWFEWSDLRIYLEFFVILEQWQEGVQELKQISRWLLGRRDEAFWDRWPDDDREWDLHDDRRVEIPDYEPARYPQESYGAGLPVDLRAKLYTFRCKLEHEAEAHKHLELLDPTAEGAAERFMDFPDCLKDIGNALLEQQKPTIAMSYFNLYRHIAESSEGDLALDADFLVSVGRCHMLMDDKLVAEEYFIAAINEDQDHIEARVQLANMYETEQEQEGREEAFLLVREAMKLELRRSNGQLGKRRGPYRRKEGAATGERKPRKPRDPNKPARPRSKYVPRRLINAEKRRQEELERTAEATKNYQIVRELKERVAAGDTQAQEPWMRAAKELIEDFRSYKEFYPWEKYIKYLGYGNTAGPDENDGFGGGAAVPARNMRLAAMAERLRQGLAPTEGEDGQAVANNRKHLPLNFPSDHRGIPFDQWLDLFLDYAFCLVRAGQHREAYIVCHAARDSTVWAAKETTFLIHVAWASCAVYAGDEETCVAIARYFMRDYQPGTDSYRMFAAMCRVCQTPVSWYTSGPAQKFILRQIKTMDNIVMKTKGYNPDAPGANDDPDGNQDAVRLDVCLLTIYGHILFTTTSYTYALSYLARAASLDPDNCMINLSVGLAYLHYALKRQATNRQYLLTQAFAFLFKYYRDRLEDPRASSGQRQEAHFNIARSYSLIGLGNLANEYYRKVLAEAERAQAEEAEREEGTERREKSVVGNEDLVIEAAYNIRTTCYLLGDVEGAKAVADRWLVLI